MWLSRTLRTENDFGTEIFYANQRVRTAFGQKINTEGIAFISQNCLKKQNCPLCRISSMAVLNGSIGLG